MTSVGPAGVESSSARMHGKRDTTLIWTVHTKQAKSETRKGTRKSTGRDVVQTNMIRKLTKNKKKLQTTLKILKDKLVERDKQLAILEKARKGAEEARKGAEKARKGAEEARKSVEAVRIALSQSKDEVINCKNKEISDLKMEVLRAKGLLSARGIFERVLNLIHDEQTSLKGKFNATNVCSKLDTLTSGKFHLLSVACGSFLYSICGAGRWLTFVWNAHKACGTVLGLSAYAKKLYSTLSAEIHGYPWATNAVQLSDELCTEDRDFLLQLCMDMGLTI